MSSRLSEVAKLGLPKVVLKQCQQGCAAGDVAVVHLHGLHISNCTPCSGMPKESSTTAQRTTAKLSSKAKPADDVLAYSAKLNAIRAAYTTGVFLGMTPINASRREVPDLVLGGDHCLHTLGQKCTSASRIMCDQSTMISTLGTDLPQYG